jgi:magnesium transporter
VIVDGALYEDGHRGATVSSVESLRTHAPTLVADDDRARPDLRTWEPASRFMWLGLRMPDLAELSSWCDLLQIDAVDPADVLTPHSRPVLTVDGSTMQLVLRTVRYDDREEVASLGEISLLVRPHSIVSIRHGPTTPLSDLRRRLEADPDRLSEGTTAVMVAVIGAVVADYGPALDGFENDAVEVEGDVFSDSRRQPVRRLYKLKRELRRMNVAIESLRDPLDRLIRVLGPHLEREVLADLQETNDQLARIVGRTKSLSDLLDSALTASLTQITVQQNDDMRRISAWVAMAAVPTLVAGVYGMNFEHMPELGWTIGYPLVLVFMALIVGLLYRNFKRSGWL